MVSDRDIAELADSPLDLALTGFAQVEIARLTELGGDGELGVLRGSVLGSSVAQNRASSPTAGAAEDVRWVKN